MHQFGINASQSTSSAPSQAVKRLSIPDLIVNISQGFQASGEKDGIGLLRKATSDEFQKMKPTLDEGMAKLRKKEAELQAVLAQRDLQKASETPLPASPTLAPIQLDPPARRVNQTILEPRKGQFEAPPAVNPMRGTIIPPHSMRPNTLRRSKSMSAADFAKNRKPAPLTMAQEILRISRTELQERTADPLSPVSPTRESMFSEANSFSPSEGRKGEHLVMRNNVLNQVDGISPHKMQRARRKESW